MPAIGIDLGTTYSCVSVVKDGKPEIIHNDQGKNITSSWVAFVDDQPTVGDYGKNYVLQEPESVVYGQLFLFCLVLLQNVKCVCNLFT